MDHVSRRFGYAYNINNHTLGAFDRIFGNVLMLYELDTTKHSNLSFPVTEPVLLTSKAGKVTSRHSSSLKVALIIL